MTLEEKLSNYFSDNTPSYGTDLEVILGVGIVISFAIIYAIDYFKKK